MRLVAYVIVSLRSIGGGRCARMSCRCRAAADAWYPIHMASGAKKPDRQTPLLPPPAGQGGLPVVGAGTGGSARRLGHRMPCAETLFPSLRHLYLCVARARLTGRRVANRFICETTPMRKALVERLVNWSFCKAASAPVTLQGQRQESQPRDFHKPLCAGRRLARA